MNQALAQNRNAGFYDRGRGRPDDPVEFSAAAFRSGHSQVRNAYAINNSSGGVRVFSLDPAVPDLRGGRRLPADPVDPLDPLDPSKQNLVIDFNNFFSELPPTTEDPACRTGDRHEDRAVAVRVADSGRGGHRVRTCSRSAISCAASSTTCRLVRPSLRRWVCRSSVLPFSPRARRSRYYVLREAEQTKRCAELGPAGGGNVSEVIVDLLNLKSGPQRMPSRTCPSTTGGDFTVSET